MRTDFDAIDTATVLAALRLFQKTYVDKDEDAIRADWPEHFAHIVPLSTEGIDELCEAINRGGVTFDVKPEEETPEPDEGPKRCPDCEKPNQFGELCSQCRQERADALTKRMETCAENWRKEKP